MEQSSPAQTDVLPDVAAVRAELERERKVTSSLLRLIASDLNLQALMQEATLLLRDWTGCEAVGIRLAQDEDFPYFETRGFPPEFVAAEKFLCDRDSEGHLRRDAEGNPLLECTCGNILRGRIDPTHPNCTQTGSYWTNSTSRSRGDRAVPDTRHNARNRCRDSGYESVALIPLRSGDTTYGLLQLNDRQPDRFSPDQILRLEELAQALAEAVARRMAMEMQRQFNENEASLVIERDLATLLGATLGRVRADGASRRSQAELRAVYDHSPIMMCVLDAERRVLSVNQAMSAFFGKREADLHFKTAGELLHCAGDLQDPRGCGFGDSCQSCALRLAINHTRVTGETSHNIERCMSIERNGGVAKVTFLASTAMLETPTGHNMLVCLQDITDQKRAEEALRDREARYRAVVETSADGFWVADLDGNILEANATYARLSGYSQAELVSMHIADLQALESRDVVMARIARIIQNGSDLFETQHRAKDGTIWQVQVSVTYWPFAGGRILVFLRDFRRRSRSEALLRTRLRLSELAQAT